MGRVLKTTEDGSHTIYDKKIEECYHSIHGAITESQHVFINNGLNFTNTNPVKILEIGFGTGLNVFLSLMEVLKNNRNIYYESVELYPLESAIIESLNYTEIVAPELLTFFKKIHECIWNENISFAPNFSLKKILGNILEIELTTLYDVIFFDAFSPDKQPEMWTRKIFDKIYRAMNVGGTLTTYCAKGLVKRNLKESGFTVEIIPGPPGKRHMIRATKK